MPRVSCTSCNGTGQTSYYVEPGGNWGTNGPDYSSFEGEQTEICSSCQGRGWLYKSKSNLLPIEPSITKTEDINIKYSLRKSPRRKDVEIVDSIRKYNFYCNDKGNSWNNPDGTGIIHDYDLKSNGCVIHDGATGLFWGNTDSELVLLYTELTAYLYDLSTSNFGGFKDWRIPTVEEALSLVEKELKGEIHLDPLFNKFSRTWTADLTHDDRDENDYYQCGYYVSYGFGRVGYAYTTRGLNSLIPVRP